MRMRVTALILVSLISVACGGGDEDPADTADVESTSTVDASSTTSTTTSDLVGPPTTRGPAPTVTVDPVGSLGGIAVLSGEPAYRGVLGQVDIDRNIVAPVALAPEAPSADGIAPLTGLALADSTVAERPAILVKIDNTSKGRPQEALGQADMVYEEMIEGGFTRLAAVFHTNAPLLGPIRSGRTTDIALINSLNTPVFAWSGANLVHAALLRRQEMVDLGAQSRSEYFRASDRPGTYNLMAEAQTLFDLAADREEGGAPPPHFEYRDETIGLPETAEPASTVTVDFPSVTATWDWDEDLDGWERTQDGTEHVDAQGERVVAANVVVAEVAQVATGSVDTAGSTVYEQQFLGSGRGWVFTDGHVVEVTWTKPSLRSVTTWTTPDGVPVALVPGITWIELAPEGSVTHS